MTLSFYVLQLCLASTIPPMLHIHSFTTDAIQSSQVPASLNNTLKKNSILKQFVTVKFPLWAVETFIYWHREGQLRQQSVDPSSTDSFSSFRKQHSRSQWQRSLGRGSVAARVQGLWEHGCLFVSCECCVLSRTGLCYGPISRPEDSNLIYARPCNMMRRVLSSGRVREWHWSGRNDTWPV